MQEAILNFLQEILETPFIEEYFYIFISLFLILGIVAFPLPDEIVMIFLGHMVANEALSFAPTLISAIFGSICGVTISYTLGRKFGYPLIQKIGSKIFITEKKIEITRKMFKKHGNWLLLFGYFIPFVRHLTAYLAGIYAKPYRIFAAYAYIGAIIWCNTFIGIGYILNPYYKLLIEIIPKYNFYILIFIIIIILTIYIWQIFKWPIPFKNQKKHKKSNKQSNN